MTEQWQELKETITEMRDNDGTGLTQQEVCKFLANLMGVLEKQIQESSGDLISLETVIEWLKSKDIIKLFSQEETARKELKSLSLVNPAEKSGNY